MTHNAMKKHTFRFNKLVRDKVEQKLRDSDIEVKIAQLNTPQDIIRAFKAKLNEEAHEVADASTVEEIVKELADCLEVVHSFIAHLKVPPVSIEHIRQDKLESHGGFQSGTMIDTITVAEDNPALAYYVDNPAKYPPVEEGS